MPSFCGVYNCGNRADRDSKSFYRLPGIPKNGTTEKIKLIEERRRRWINALKRSDLTDSKIKYLRICEDHFLSGKPSALDDMDNPDWVPSKNMGYDNSSDGSALNRHDRRKRRRDDGENSHVQTMDINFSEENLSSEPPESMKLVSVHVQTDFTMKDIVVLQDVCQDLQTQLSSSKNALKNMKLDESSICENDDKVKYYTGIPSFTTLSIIFDLVKPFISETALSSLSKFQKFLLTMMHLRLNLDFTDLGYRFNCSKYTASRIFSECLNIMHERLSCMVLWPEREQLMAKVPLTFLESFGRKVTVIIDCFETKIEKPGNLIAGAQCYSHYKHHHTIKYLIGISPQGAIIFISSAWGGRTSDKHIVQNSGFLEKLLPGDLVLADRGFNVQDEVGLYCAELKLPAFTKGKTQLDPIDVEATRKLAHVRIHVERVIGQLRQKYTILNDVMPINMVKKSNASHSVVDQIVRVCCALVNFMPSVIPME